MDWEPSPLEFDHARAFGVVDPPRDDVDHVGGQPVRVPVRRDRYRPAVPVGRFRGLAAKRSQPTAQFQGFVPAVDFDADAGYVTTPGSPHG
jgi:hypothetical protein